MTWRFRCYLLAGIFLAGCAADNIERKYNFAEKLWDEGQYELAVTEYQRVAAKDPKGTIGIQARVHAANILSLYLGKHEQAIENLEFIIANIRDEGLKKSALIEIGEIYYERLKDYRRAIPHFKRRLENSVTIEEKAELFFLIARCFFYLLKFDEAISSYSAVTRIAPGSYLAERAALEIAETYYTKGDKPNFIETEQPKENYRKALESFQSYILRYPLSMKLSYAYFGAAASLEALDDYERAYEEFLKIKDVYPYPNLIQIRMIRIKERLNRRTQSGPR